jgi:rubrerythrin
MKQPTDLGMNKTGIDSSPIDIQELLSGVKKSWPSSDGDESTLASYRSSYLAEADPIGTVPLPGTLKGAAKSGMQKLMGKKPEVLIDKLGARLAFERTGTRLYDAFLGKCEIRRDEVNGLPLKQLREFRDEEAQHFALVRDALKVLGADPTAQTPGADVDGVASLGLMHVVTDPRTSVAQSLHAIHVAELADHDGWELLIKLAEELGQDDMVGDFRQAFREEERHLATIRQLMEILCLGEVGAPRMSPLRASRRARPGQSVVKDGKKKHPRRSRRLRSPR